MTGEAEAPRSNLHRGRRRPLLIILAASLVCLGAGVALGRTSVSPAQQAASARPPAPTPIDVTVEERVLEHVVPLRCVASSAIQRDLPVPDPERAGSSSIVTWRSTGSVTPGGAVIAVSGRPVIFLPGSVPLFRDLAMGDRGDDVTALQRGLQAAGFATSDPEGVFGPGTSASVSALYAKADSAPKLSQSDNGQVVGSVAPHAELALVDASSVSLGVDAPGLGEVLAAGATVSIDGGERALRWGGADGADAGVVVGTAVRSSGRAGVVTAVDEGGTMPGSTPSAGALPPSGPTDAAPGGSAGVPVTGGAGARKRVFVVRLDGPQELPTGEVVVDAVDQTSSTPTLVVPATALSTDANGTAVVHVGDRVVPVVVGMAANGWVGVQAADGQLAAGDAVRVGTSGS